MKPSKKAAGKFKSFGDELNTANLLEEFEDPILLLGVDLNVRFANSACLQFLGYSSGDLDGVSFFRLLPPEEGRETEQFLKDRVTDKNTKFERDYDLIKKDGSSIRIPAYTRALQNSDKSVYIMLRFNNAERRVEEALKKSDQLYTTLFNEAPIPVLLTKLPERRIIDANEAWSKMYGFSKEEAVGKTSVELGINREGLSNDSILTHLREQKRLRNFEHKLYNKDGDEFTVLDNICYLEFNGEAYALIVSMDITERLKMEETLQAKDFFNRAIMDNLPIGIAVNSNKPLPGFEYMNDNFPRFYGTTREALKGIDVFFDAVYEDAAFREEIRNRVLSDMQSGDAKRMRWENVPITRKGMATKYISAYNVLVPERGMQISIVSDETEHVEALHTLEKNAARFQKMHEFDQAIIRGFESFEMIGTTALSYIDALIGPEKAGIGIFEISGRAVQIVSSEKGVSSYRHYETAVTDLDLELLSSLQRGSLYDTEALPNQRMVEVIWRAFELDTYPSGLVRPLYSAEGQIGILFIGRARDNVFSQTDRDIIQEIGLQCAMAIEQKRLQLQNDRYATRLEEMIRDRTIQLEEAVKELEAFTYTVSHDLRAPLRSLNGFVRILMEDYGNVLDDEGKRVCGVIMGSAQQMGQLIDDLLALSKFGRSSMVIIPVNMEHMVKSLFVELTTEEQRARIDFSVGPLPEAAADPTLIRQVWLNLLDNAIKFSSKKPKPKIRIEGRDEGIELVYAVTDNGAGFDVKYRDKLFGVFQRLHSIKEYDGTGVGLAIVHRIIQRHGGRTWAVGEENKGATFYFSIRKGVKTDDSGSH